MPPSRRSTVYLEPELHRAVKLKAAETDRSVSDVINEALRLLLAEDAEDLAAIRDRVSEPTITYEALLSELRQKGLV